MRQPFEIDVEALDAMRKSGTPHVALDVREAWEVDIAAIDGSLHIPLNTLPGKLEQLPKDCPIVVICHHGGRSAQATMFLRHKGFDNATNLDGGVDAWARRIDTTMRTY